MHTHTLHLCQSPLDLPSEPVSVTNVSDSTNPLSIVPVVIDIVNWWHGLAHSLYLLIILLQLLAINVTFDFCQSCIAFYSPGLLVTVHTVVDQSNGTFQSFIISLHLSGCSYSPSVVTLTVKLTKKE